MDVESSVGDNIQQLGALDVRTSAHLVPYAVACQRMHQDVEQVKQGGREKLWFLQHPEVYTHGVRTDPDHVAMAKHTGLPVYSSNRGGQLTFHSPGQRIVYAILNLRHRGLGIIEYIDLLQRWIIDALNRCGVKSFVLPHLIGVWTERGKIASIGVRVSGGISSHGMSLCVIPDQTLGCGGFNAIIPCGLEHISVVSVRDFKPDITLSQIDAALLQTNPFVDGL